jgi:uncharacterized protein YbcC (UPF0753/DUF2309 family)
MMTSTPARKEHAVDRISPDQEKGMAAGRTLESAIEHAAHLLPAQGPITVFIHHNTLHAFEDLPFTDAVCRGAEIFGCQPYLSEERYREELRRGRIRFADLQASLRRDLKEHGEHPIPGLVSRFELRLAMLQYPLCQAPTEELLWFVAETDALRRIRPEVSAVVRGRLIAETRRWVMGELRGKNTINPERERTLGAGLSKLLAKFRTAPIEEWGEEDWEHFTLQTLWRVCCDGLTGVCPLTRPKPRTPRHRDLLLQATGEDSDQLVHDVLIRFSAAFLDQGLASWQLPSRDLGLFRSFVKLYRNAGIIPERWRRALARELARIDAKNIEPLDSIHESLEALGVGEAECDEFLSATLLALPGWGGMVQEVERRADVVRQPIRHGSLIEFVAVRLLLERFALEEVARRTEFYAGPLRGLRPGLRERVAGEAPPSVEQRAFLVFQLAQLLGWTPTTLNRLPATTWAELVEEIEAFCGIERRRLFHLAYEHRFVTQSLDALALHRWSPRKTSGRARFQASFCLDDREESMRRHLEEVAPDVETFGIAGFYGVAMYYRGASDAHFVPICPIIIRPKHWVTEQVVEGFAETNERRARARRALGTLSLWVHVRSRTFGWGALLTAGLGVLASIPLVARTLFPRLAARVRGMFGRVVQTPPSTQLNVERTEPTPGPANGHTGYTIDEMADVTERQLRDIGLTGNFARLVFLLGHGSRSLNNPHRSAYDCGACGGSPGAPSGRALAQMLNHPRVRGKLLKRGMPIPFDTIFVGGLHNTCNDTITLYDLASLPESHRADLAAAQHDFNVALKRNAHERCRRFMSAPLTLSFDAAWEHVEERSEDLAQPRPELGHATNALCIVGRRARTRGLFLDRRAFLTSYDPSKDPEGAILLRLLQAAVPVCAGINLEYYFSRVDNDGFGCGSKLPHNVSALLGVMNGAASDLRTGLPWQMVEIHEPVRLLFIIETTPEVILRIMDANPGIGRVFRNGWALLAVQDPETGSIQKFRDGVFCAYQPEAQQLPQAAASVDWYCGFRDHLEFAEIGD